MNCIHKGTKTGKHRIHLANANGSPLCGGGNSARAARWQEVILEADCHRCRQILERRQPMNPEIKNINIHLHGSVFHMDRWMMDIKINGVKAQHERCLHDYASPADAITSARHVIRELKKGGQMILLKNRRAWVKWAKTFNGSQMQCAPAAEPRQFPCYVYETVASFNYEESNANYLDADDLAAMIAQIKANRRKP